MKTIYFYEKKGKEGERNMNKSPRKTRPFVSS